MLKHFFERIGLPFDKFLVLEDGRTLDLEDESHEGAQITLIPLLSSG